MVSVIPDNRDMGLVVSRPGKNFWDRVRSWQSRIKLRNAVRIFRQQGVKPEVWVAPAPSLM